MNSNEAKILTRDVEAAVVPVGTKVTLQKGETGLHHAIARRHYTVVVNGNMFRIDGKDADALGLEVQAQAGRGHQRPGDAGATGKTGLGRAQDVLRPGNSRQHRGPRPDLRLPPHARRRKQFQGRRENDVDRARLRHGADARAGRAEQIVSASSRLTRRTSNWSGTRRGTRA